jgi:prepilin-type N-terminal cleavage/methylation domain-containing protein
MNKQKKGFTLIELMVVIVIIGILAAIAIPKLFGMTAKAKAQEVGPAAGTWSKLQQAFIAETGSVGSNVKIAYTPPGAASTTAQTGSTSNFYYRSSLGGTSATGTDASHMTSGTSSWTASNIGALNDCTAAANWTATVNAANGSAQATVSTTAGCAQLTPNFDKLR